MYSRRHATLPAARTAPILVRAGFEDREGAAGPVVVAPVDPASARRPPEDRAAE